VLALHGAAAEVLEPAVEVADLLSGGGLDVLVRYVTRASERFELRNRLYQKVIEVLREPGAGAGGAAVVTAKG